MTTRRAFVKGAAAAASGIVFCGCEWLGMAHAQSSAGPTLPVAVNGKRVKTIDVHAHCLFHDAATLMGTTMRPSGRR